MVNSRIPSSPRRSGSEREKMVSQSFFDMFFGFLEDEEGHRDDQGMFVSPVHNYGSSEHVADEHDHGHNEIVEEEEKDDKFWENQNQILQATLRRTSCLETGIRNAVKQAIQELKISGTVCGCGRQMATDICRNFCVLREVSRRLRTEGYNSAVCKSKWRCSPDMPSGEHTFLDVVDNSSPKKGEVRVIIEVNFRAEFEMARVSDEYNRLVHRLPEVFVGKIERLHSVVKIMCSAAKKCMKEKKMHIGPWRKQRYMQAKWLGACERTASPAPTSSTGDSAAAAATTAMPRAPTAKAASMLTVDLLEGMMPNGNMHCKPVSVV